MIFVCPSGVYSRVMYTELNEKLERMSKFVYTVFVEASLAGLIIPPLLITLVNYFIYDLSEESYFLPTPVMYVREISFQTWFDWEKKLHMNEFILPKDAIQLAHAIWIFRDLSYWIWSQCCYIFMRRFNHMLSDWIMLAFHSLR